MKKLLITIFLIFLLAYFINPKILVYGEDSQTIQSSGYNQVCLDAQTPDLNQSWSYCGGCPHPGNFNQDETKCEDWGGTFGLVHQCYDSHVPDNGQARFSLTNKTNCPNPQDCKLPSGVPIYVKVCTGVESDGLISQECTTSIPEIDAKYSLTGSSIILSYPDNPTGEFFTDAQGNITINGVISNIAGFTTYNFYAIFDPQLMGSGGNDTAVITGQAASQQLGTTQFTLASFTAGDNKESCASIYWDPYGRVFDSRSLEPMSGIEIRALTGLNPEILANVSPANHVKSKDDGVYTFLTQPGTYYLRLTNVPATHSFISNPILNPKYNLIYHMSNNGNMSLYKPDEPIKELIDTPEEAKKGVPDAEERDIPLDPGTNTPYVTNIKSMFISENIENNQVVIRGKASHAFPFLTIKDAQGNIYLNKQEFTNDKARYGFWQVSIPAAQFPVTKSIIPVLFKNPKYYQTDNLAIVDNTNVQIQPILRNIQGYAKDNKGNVIPNADIEIVLEFKDKFFYSTKADEKGYFEITSTHLPPEPYYLKINGQKVSTSSFSLANAQYLTANKINLMNVKVNSSDISTTNSGLLNNSNKNINGNVNQNNISKNINQMSAVTQLSSFKKEIILVIILLSFLFLTVLMLILYIKKHKNT